MGLFDRFKKPTSVKDPAPGGGPVTGELRCPNCKHAFVPPRILMVTQAVVDRYGPNPVQCPECKHIWSRGKKA